MSQIGRKIPVFSPGSFVEGVHLASSPHHEFRMKRVYNVFHGIKVPTVRRIPHFFGIPIYLTLSFPFVCFVFGSFSLFSLYAAFLVAGGSPHTNSLSSTNIRCRITANFLPTANEAFFSPFFLIILSPQALSLLHFLLLVSSTTPASVSRARSSLEPHFEIRPCLIVSPEEYCLGVIPK